MNWFEALVLGIVQGLTEFLPISSSAHLRIVGSLAGWGDPGAAFTAVTQLGTETAVVLYFRKKIGSVLAAWFRSLVSAEWRRDADARLGWLVIVGSLPIVVLGLLFEEQIEHVFRDLRLISLSLIVFGVILGVADHIGRKQLDLDQLTVGHGITYGIAQAFALVPGVSRSGGTITAGRLLGYKREDATEYAFLLAVPAVFGSGIYQLTDIGSGPAPSWGATIFATIVAFAIGYSVIAWLMRFITTHSYLAFVIYRIVLGLFVLALVSLGVIAPT